MPRTKKLTEEQLKQVEKLAGILTAEQLADFLGISRTTFFEMLKRDKKLDGLYKKARAKLGGAVGQSLVQAALNGDAVRQMFYLKTQFGWKEQKEEQTSDEKLVQLLSEVVNKLPD